MHQPHQVFGVVGVPALAKLLAGLLESIIEGPLGPVLSEEGLVTLLADPQAATAMSMQLLELAVQLRSGSAGLRLLPTERREA